MAAAKGFKMPGLPDFGALQAGIEKHEIDTQTILGLLGKMSETLEAIETRLGLIQLEKRKHDL